jgi:heme exporter protein C
MSWLYTKWWKYLCVLLLLYVVVGSFMIPLGPGIQNVEPTTFSEGSVTNFKISGYHSHFKNPGNGKVQLWFKSGNDYFCPLNISIINDGNLEASFKVPVSQHLLQSGFDVVVNDPADGTFALRDAISLTYNRADTSSTAGVDTLSPCKVEVANNKAQFLSFPYREILYESIRNTFFHVPMWFTMTALVFFSLISSIRYLAKGDFKLDVYAHQSIVVALLFGICGLLTGSVWARYTWGHFWVNDPKLNGAAIGVVIYFAYLILRGSLPDEIKRARISAAYNIFAIVVFMLFIFIMPRLTDSLHPGNGGNPAFSKYDLDNTLRMFFYPACIGWILLGFWILSVLVRIDLIKRKQEL